jgi:hypothetical protein
MAELGLIDVLSHWVFLFLQNKAFIFCSFHLRTNFVLDKRECFLFVECKFDWVGMVYVYSFLGLLGPWEG